MRMITTVLLIAIGVAMPSNFLATAVAAVLPARATVYTAVDTGCPDDFNIEYEIDAFDPNPKHARKEAHQVLADDIQILADSLHEDCYIQSVTTEGEWDGGIVYTLHVFIAIHCDCDGG